MGVALARPTPREVRIVALMISMVAFSQPPQLSVAEVSRFLAEHWPSLPAATEASESEGILSLRLSGADVIVGSMPAPIPWSELEGPCATSILRRDAALRESACRARRGGAEPITAAARASRRGHAERRDAAPVKTSRPT